MMRRLLLVLTAPLCLPVLSVRIAPRPDSAPSYKLALPLSRPFEGENYWQNSQGQVSRLRPNSPAESDVMLEWLCGLLERAWDRTLAGYVFYRRG